MWWKIIPVVGLTLCCVTASNAFVGQEYELSPVADVEVLYTTNAVPFFIQDGQPNLTLDINSASVPGNGTNAAMEFNVRGLDNPDDLVAASLIVTINLTESSFSNGETTYPFTGVLGALSGGPSSQITLSDVQQPNTVLATTEVTTTGKLELPLDLDAAYFTGDTFGDVLADAIGGIGSPTVLLLYAPSQTTPDLTVRLYSTEGAAPFAGNPGFDIDPPTLKLTFVPEPASAFALAAVAMLTALRTRRRR